MFGVFGKAKSLELSAALNKTFEKFENMPAKEFFGIAREHSGGDVAAFLSACSGTGDSSTKELKFLFDSADPGFKSFTAFFSQKSTLTFSSGAESQCPHPYSVSNAGHAYVGVASVTTLAIGTAYCQAA